MVNPAPSVNVRLLTFQKLRWLAALCPAALLSNFGTKKGAPSFDAPLMYFWF